MRGQHRLGRQGPRTQFERSAPHMCHVPFSSSAHVWSAGCRDGANRLGVAVRGASGVRLSFVGAHFPIVQLAAVLESDGPRLGPTMAPLSGPGVALKSGPLWKDLGPGTSRGQL